MSSDQTVETTAWLTRIGREELQLVRELGWDHPEVLEVQHRFRGAYQAIKAIRKAYEAPPSQENN